MWPILKFVSGRHLRHRRGRAALTVIGTMLGVAMIMAVFSLNSTITDAYTKLFSGLAGKADVEIAALSAAGIDEDLLEAAQTVDGVAAAAPAVKGNTIIFGPPGRPDAEQGAAPVQASVFLLGVDPSATEYSMRTYVLQAGRLLRPDDGRALMLTESLASQLGVAPGDDVQLLTVVGKRTFRLVGLLGPGGTGFVNAGQLVVLPLEEAQRLLGKPGRIDQIGLTLVPTANEQQVEANLRTLVGEGAHVGRPTSGRAVEDVLGSLNLMLTFASGISLFAAFFLMYNNVAMAMTERRREHGILISLGLTGRTLLRTVLLEAALLSLLGGALGVGLGISLANVMVQALGDTLAGALRLGVAGVRANPLAAAGALGAGLMAALFAAAGPARHATRLTPTAVMRSVPPLDPPRRRRHWFIASALVLVGVVGTFVLLLNGTPANFAVLVWPLFAAMLVAFVGIILALEPVVHQLPTVLGRPLRAVLGVPGSLAAANLGRWPARTATTIGALLVALSMLVGVTALTESYRTYLHRWVEQDTDWDLLVSSSWLGMGAETPMEEHFRARIETVPGVALASPERFVFLDFGSGRVYLSIFDMGEFGQFAGFNVAAGPPSEDVIETLAQEDAVAVSRPFALVHDVEVGDTLYLPAPGGNYPVRLAAVVDDMSLAGGTMYIDRSLYKRLWRDEAVDAFAVKVAPGADPEAVRTRLLATLGADGPGATGNDLPLTIQTSYEFSADLDQMVTESFSLIQALVLVALIVAVLGVANTLVMTVLERRRELVELRALGATRRHVRRLVLGEALGTGLVGSGLGALVGLVIAVAMVEANRRFIGLAYPLVLPPSLVVMTAGLGVVLAPLAGWIPARIAAGMNIVEGMRVE